FENGQKLAEDIESVDGFEKAFTGIHFNECLIKSRKDANKINEGLLKKGIQGGLVVDRWYPELKNHMLFGISEMHSDEDRKKLVSALKEVSNV
ncbi:MAG: aminomethyl-transferring glycine dehydrogenase, partial [Candidatus Thermoplasmatota archaeon]|nr:aminomethyl-transferring glycine dehydrogenase [Candidatus Thermoplasmatota archaeon]